MLFTVVEHKTATKIQLMSQQDFFFLNWQSYRIDLMHVFCSFSPNASGCSVYYFIVLYHVNQQTRHIHQTHNYE